MKFRICKNNNNQYKVQYRFCFIWFNELAHCFGWYGSYDDALHGLKLLVRQYKNKKKVSKFRKIYGLLV